MKSSSNLDDDFGSLLSVFITENDWNFDLVPDQEIVACCLWEYARDSSTIRHAAGTRWCNVRHIINRERYKTNPIAKIEDDERAAQILRQAEASGFDYDKFSDQYWASDLAFLRIYDFILDHCYEGALTWNSLPQKTKAFIVKKTLESDLFRPASLCMVGELERIWEQNSKDLQEIRAKPRPENDDSEDCALCAESQVVAISEEESTALTGKVAAAFTVDFARFTDKEILAAFKTWVQSNRPAQWKTPKRIFPGAKQKGRKLVEYRVAVERLGLMRILHYIYPSEMRHHLPKAWRKYGPKRLMFRRELREATKFFHRLFPFLPSGEQLSCKMRCNIWRRECDKIAEKVEKELGLL
jgi:hypothetical protein